MLSELCVRRPVFATMLVTSLVVLGIFSFRDLGVDLFPKADPATVNVRLQLPGASPDEMVTSVVMPMENALSGIAGIDQLQANVQAGGSANITVRFVLERDLDDAANNVREKVAGAMRAVPPEVLPPGHPEAGPRRRLDHDDRPGVEADEHPRAHRGGRQAGEACARIGGRRRRGHAERRPARARSTSWWTSKSSTPAACRSSRCATRFRRRTSRSPAAPSNRALGGGAAHLGRIEATSQFDNIIIATVGGVPVRVADIGLTEDSVEKTANVLTLEDGSPPVQLEIRRASGENTIR
jgi:HAE1 family hydrophobic/amphiphilic exporter-1